MFGSCLPFKSGTMSAICFQPSWTFIPIFYTPWVPCLPAAGWVLTHHRQDCKEVLGFTSTKHHNWVLEKNKVVEEVTEYRYHISQVGVGRYLRSCSPNFSHHVRRCKALISSTLILTQRERNWGIYKPGQRLKFGTRRSMVKWPHERI